MKIIQYMLYSKHTSAKYGYKISCNKALVLVVCRYDIFYMNKSEDGILIDFMYITMINPATACFKMEQLLVMELVIKIMTKSHDYEDDKTLHQFLE